MKRLACLVIVAAFALPCAASGPTVDETVEPKKPIVNPWQIGFQAPKIVIPPPKLLSDETVFAILCPAGAYAEKVAYRIKLDRFMRQLVEQQKMPSYSRSRFWPLLD